VWSGGFVAGKFNDNAGVTKVMDEILKSNKVSATVAPWLKQLLSQEEKSKEEKNRAMAALANMKGNPTNGQAVFKRICVACHKVGKTDEQEFGPNMDKVGTKLTKLKIIESIIDPNAEVEAKYLSTRIVTSAGKTVTGLLVSESKTQVVLFDGKEKVTIKVGDIEERTQLKQSSMPEGQAGTMSPAEFLDLVEYLSRLK
jgi:putative heme-binding domain-containing protein